TTYWRVTAPLPPGTYIPELVFTRPDGSQAVIRDFATAQWRPMAAWQPGQVYALRNWPYIVTGREIGSLQLGVRVVQTSGSGGTPAPLVVSSASGVSLGEGGTLVQFARERVAS